MDDVLYSIFDLFNINSFVNLLVPEPCYTTFFRKYEFSDVGCLKVLISKCLGYGIICGSVLVKVPQILKIFCAKSGQGIDLSSVTLELVACMSTLCYGYNKGFPFSAYGEAIFMSLQNCLIGAMILFFAGKKNSAITYMLSFVLLLSYLMSTYCNEGLLWILQALVIPNCIVARGLQIITNFRNNNTGQLSSITITLLMLGSLARVFTSWVETNDRMVTTTFVISFITNCIIFAQVMYYWHLAKVLIHEDTHYSPLSGGKQQQTHKDASAISGNDKNDALKRRNVKVHMKPINEGIAYIHAK